MNAPDYASEITDGVSREMLSANECTGIKANKCTIYRILGDYSTCPDYILG